MISAIPIILISGYFFGYLANILKIPKLLGMILAGLIIGPYSLNLISNSFMVYAPIFKNIALVIIIIRAGLALDFKNYLKNKKVNFKLSFIPGLIECLGISLIALLLFKLSFIEALMLGSIVAATSPAVVVDRGLKLKEENYSTKTYLPDILISGGALDAIFILMFFNLILNIYQSNIFNFFSIIAIPTNALFGISLGIGLGYLLNYLIKKISNYHFQVISILIISCLLYFIEKSFVSIISFSSLLAIMSIGTLINKEQQKSIKKLRYSFKQIWEVAQIFLFVLVGCSLDLSQLNNNIIPALIIIVCALIIRIISILILLIKSDYTIKERIFCALAFTPKATVQASIGTIPLSLGFSFGNTFLMISTLTIIITTSLGTMAIDKSYRELLKKEV